MQRKGGSGDNLGSLLSCPVGTAEAAGLAGRSAHGLTLSSCMGTAVVLLSTISGQSYGAAMVMGSELFTADSPLRPAGFNTPGVPLTSVFISSG